jgi:hypothetical protein
MVTLKCRSVVSSTTNPTFVSVSNETQVPGSSLPWRLNFLRWLATFFWSWVRNLLRFTLLAPRILKWLLDFQKICAPLQYDEFHCSDICESDTCFLHRILSQRKEEPNAGPKTVSAGARYRKLPIVCIAFLFELVTSCSASKCPYYQSIVNTLSKFTACCFISLVVKLSDAFRSLLIASSFRFIFVYAFYSVLWKMPLLVEFTILFLLPPLVLQPGSDLDRPNYARINGGCLSSYIL